MVLMKRIFDLTLSINLFFMLIFPMLIISIIIKVTSKGPILYWSKRVGKDNVIFEMPKFRSMKVGTPAVATHLLLSPEDSLTLIGGFIRRSSLDELPQLWCVLVGTMSFVGPRPALYNQYDLIKLRTDLGVDKILPGITGWAQVNGRDEISIALKVKFDKEYLDKKSMFFDFKVFYLTFLKVVHSENVSH